MTVINVKSYDNGTQIEFALIYKTMCDKYEYLTGLLANRNYDIEMAERNLDKATGAAEQIQLSLDEIEAFFEVNGKNIGDFKTK